MSDLPAPRSVVVTGGAGFIGTHVVAALQRQPSVDRVVVLDDLSSGSRANLERVPGAELVEGSILSRELVDATCAGADAVVHLAAQVSVAASVDDPAFTHEVNSTGTVHVLEAARTHGLHVVLASSSAVYGANPALPKHEELAPDIQSPYAASKLAAEATGLAYQAVFGIGVLALRFFNVFGPLQPAGHAYAAVIPSFVDAALAGRPLQIFGDGEQTRDFIDVGSVADIVAAAVARRRSFAGPVNVAFGTRRSLLDVVATLQDVLGHEVAVEHLPERAGDVRHSQADDRRLRSLFPEVTPREFADALADTVAWWQETARVA